MDGRHTDPGPGADTIGRMMDYRAATPWRVRGGHRLKSGGRGAVSLVVTSLVLSTPRVSRERSRRFAGELQQRGFTLSGRIVRAGLPRVDHIVVAPSGVWVVACEHVPCARVSVRRRHLAGDQLLRIGGRDRTSLLDQLDHQVAAVRAELFDALDAPVQAALVLPGAEFPLLRSLVARDHLILRPAQLLGELEGRGPLRRARAREVAGLLDARLA